MLDLIKNLAVPSESKIVLLVADGLGGLPAAPGGPTDEPPDGSSDAASHRGVLSPPSAQHDRSLGAPKPWVPGYGGHMPVSCYATPSAALSSTLSLDPPMAAVASVTRRVCWQGVRCEGRLVAC